jgi:hypothetical protein
VNKIFSTFFHGLVLMALAGGLFLGSFFYEGNFLSTLASQKPDQLIVRTDGKAITVNRAGQDINLENGGQVGVGDVIASMDLEDLTINFAKDGELRLDKQSKVLISAVGSDNHTFVFKVIEGRVWLQNSFSNVDVNLIVDGAAIFPGQSVLYVNVVNGRSDVSVQVNDAVIGLISTDFNGNKLLNENSPEVINKLYLPQGTMVSVSADKVRDNQETIAKLLYSKLVKEFNYSIFDRTQLITDLWLSKNVERDNALTSRIRNERLKKIRTRGLKYSSLDASNYKIDQTIRDLSNSLTFSGERVGQRNLDALYDLLYDAQYLFDYGRKEEAQERLNTFSAMANQLFAVYGEGLKKQYVERVRDEYEYLSFASPSDSLFGLRQVLEKIYLDSIKGDDQELAMKFVFLTEQLTSLGYFAENKDYKNLKDTFDQYMVSFKDLTQKYQKEITADITFVQRQNQALDNLFVQYASLYRQTYFTNKLYVENKYLSLLPATKDKPEEIQSVIAQRIDFLRRLQNFFLDGEVPLVDAQNILALLFSEISKIELPADYKVAVTGLFNERLQDFGIFSRFLNSPEYVSSTVRGSTPRERFEQFKLDNEQDLSLEEIREELSTLAGGENELDLGVIPPDEGAVIIEPVINEEVVTTDIDGNVTVTENEVPTDTSTETTTKPKVPRVKRTN